MEPQNFKKLSKFIALVLRHQPDAAGITLDAEGWAEVPALIAGMRSRGMTLEVLQEIVRADSKGRYTFSQDGSRIRANQGHSVEVEVEMDQLDPPELLYHGTVSDHRLNLILAEGLKKMSRLHVHLSGDVETARQVGGRRGRPVILRINAGQMYRDGFTFWRSQNGVWLTDHVPAKYLLVL